jgi:hypothetical protein
MNRQSLGPGAKRDWNFNQKTVIRTSDADVLSKAESHAIGRNSAVAEVLNYLSLLRSANVIKANDRVSSDAAGVQVGRGTRPEPAAHCLPCQILINGQSPARLIRNPGLEERLNALFGKCTMAPKVVNDADYLAEGHRSGRPALIPAFEETCQAVVQSAALPQREQTFRGVAERSGENSTATVWSVNRSEVRRIYIQIWVMRSRAAYERALVQVRADAASKLGQPVVPAAGPGEITPEQLAGYTDRHLYYDHLVAILRRYLEALADQPSALRDDKMSELERDFSSRLRIAV